MGVNLFGEEIIVEQIIKKPVFFVKEHNAKIAGLHYDLRIQFPIIIGKKKVMDTAKSFAVQGVPSMNPEDKVIAVLVDDHPMNAKRREGTFLNETGAGSVLHFDEGYFNIPGCDTMIHLAREFGNGLKRGYLEFIFDGYKLKGKFSLTRMSDDANEKNWTLQKCVDEYSIEKYFKMDMTSLLSGHKIEYYDEMYEEQMKILPTLSEAKLAKFIKDNNGQSFIFNKYQLRSRPDKIWDYE